MLGLKLNHVSKRGQSTHVGYSESIYKCSLSSMIYVMVCHLFGAMTFSPKSPNSKSDPITTKFCTYQDSYTVLVRTKFHCNQTDILESIFKYKIINF